MLVAMRLLNVVRLFRSIIPPLRLNGACRGYLTVLGRYYPGLSISDALAVAWPRCPICGSPLVQKMASSRLICTGCGKEFELREVD